MYHGRPCVILKMNNIYGWEPKPYYNLTQVINNVLFNQIDSSHFFWGKKLFSFSLHPKNMAFVHLFRIN